MNRPLLTPQTTGHQTYNRKNPYALFLKDIEKPARYIGGENFSAIKDWSNETYSMALCFPEVYEIAMSHLGYKILYQEINKQPDLIAERCFAPWIDLEEQLRNRQLPLVTLENYKPLSDFDVVGFSLQYEMTYTNILNMLNLGGIPIWQSERNEESPFVIAGGPCASHPEPIAPFFDIILIGDAEEILPQIIRFIGEGRRQKIKRQELLEELSSWSGLYIPSLYSTGIDPITGFEVVTKPNSKNNSNPIQKRTIDSLDSYPFPIKSPIPHASAIFDKFSIEISRGCTEGCRFCQAGMLYRPARERKPKDIIDSIKKGLQESGYNEASLTCLSTADYSSITPLILDLLEHFEKDNSSLGIASLRAYGLNEEVLNKMARTKNTSLTFAPEAGTDRMRRVINKNIQEQDILETTQKIFSRGWKKMKLYYMIGLPTETDFDIEEIMATSSRVKQEAKKSGATNPQITVSVSSFIPKPHTPFQWCPMISLDEIERKQNILWQNGRKFKLNFRKHFSKVSILEGIIARGDRRLAPVIYSAWENHCRFDSWEEKFQYSSWEKALQKYNINTSLYLGTIPLEGKLPWSHINIGVKTEFLKNEWNKALNAETTFPCGKILNELIHPDNLTDFNFKFKDSKQKLVCYACGVKCNLKKMVMHREENLKELGALKQSPLIENTDGPINSLLYRSKRGQNVGHKYRIKISKIGPMSFLSHLEFQKVIARIFKRSNIKTLISEGHNQRPLISFGPALTLGINSLCEFIDVRTDSLWDDLEKKLSELNESSERGVLFNSIKLIDKKTASIQNSLNKVVYFIPISSHQNINDNQLTNVLNEINNASSLPVLSFNKKQNKNITKDLATWIIDVKLNSLNLELTTQNIISEVTPPCYHHGIELTANVDKGVSIKPLEIERLFQERNIQTCLPIKTETFFNEI